MHGISESLFHREQVAANISRKGDLFVGTLPCLNRRRTHGPRTVATISCRGYSEEGCPVQATSIIQRMLFSRYVIPIPFLIITRNVQLHKQRDVSHL